MSIQWSLVIFSLFSGVGGCLFAFIGVNELTQWSKKKTLVQSIVALVLLVVGGFASVTHLSHPARVLNALSHPTSGIFIEAVLIGLTILCIVIYLVCAQRNADGAAKAFGVVGGALGLVFAFMSGHSYMMQANGAWNTLLLPVGYLTTALAVGAGLWWVLCAPDEENGSKQAILATVVFTVVALVSVGAYAVAVGAFASGDAIAVVCTVCAALAAILAFVGRSKPLPACAWSVVVVAAIVALLFRILMWNLGGGIFAFFG